MENNNGLGRYLKSLREDIKLKSGIYPSWKVFAACMSNIFIGENITKNKKHSIKLE